MKRTFCLAACLLLTGATPGPSTGLIDKGEAGIAIYGLLFVIVVLLGFCGALLRSLSGRDKLIETMVTDGRQSAREQSDTNLKVATQLSVLVSLMGGRNIGDPL